MKYLSELTNKTYDSVEDCEKAEKEFNDAKEKEKELAISVSKEKKELAKAVEETETALNAEYENYSEAKKQAEEILKKANDEATELLTKAREKVRQAEQAKYQAISNFNKKFGVYTKSYRGDDARRELERSIGWINDVFNSFFF